MFGRICLCVVILFECQFCILALAFDSLSLETSGLVVRLHNIYILFEYQDHWINVKVTTVK